MRPKYKDLYEKALKEITQLTGFHYTVFEEGYLESDHEHSFDEWELASEGGIAYCNWKCSCGLVVSQFLGERGKPEKLPDDLSRFKEWRE